MGSAGSVSKLLIPNTTQVPNILLDEVMPTLRGGALKVLLAIVRFTYGFGKQTDQISLKQLQTLTGLSREGVVQGVQALGDLVSVKRGAKGVGANEYSLNLNISTGELVNKVDWSKKLTSQQGSQQSRPSQTYSKPKKKYSAKAKPSRPKDSDPRVKEFIAWFVAGYQSAFNQLYHVKGGKDGQLVKDLLKTFDLPELERRALLLWQTEDSFIAKTDRGIGILASQVNKLTGATIQPAQPHVNDAPRGDLRYREAAHG